MKPKLHKRKLTLILGGITLFLFSARPYLLDLIEPAKSIGQVIGENAKDIIDSMNGKSNIEPSNSKREIWSNIILIAAFVLLGITLIYSIIAIKEEDKKSYAIGGGLLGLLGLGIYISHLAIGLIGLVVIALIIGAIVFREGLI